jgi:hypothetical protein
MGDFAVEGKSVTASTTEYMSFMIRLWREQDPERPEVAADWQGEVEHIQSGRHWRFGTLDEVLRFLRQQARNPDPTGFQNLSGLRCEEV